MRNRNLKITLIALALSSSGVYAQKMYETSAALEYQTFQQCVAEAMQKRDTSALINCKESYDKARDYIDKAASNPSTENSPKTLFYKGQIYIASMYLHANDSTYMNNHGEKDFNDGLSSLKKAYEDKKYKKEVESYVAQNVFQFNMGASQMFKEKKYVEAGSLYELAAKFNDVIGKADSTSLYNAGISYQAANKHEEAAEKFEELAKMGYKPAESYANTITNLVDAKKLDKVKSLIEEAIKKYPNDKDVLIAGVNYYFSVNDMNSAQTLLDKAVEQDPDNYVLLYNVGTINLKKDNFDKAEQAFLKVVSLKPDYYEAYYQLGAVYVNKYSGMVDQLENMNSNDPKFKALDESASATIKKAIPPLEKYLEKYPEDKSTLLNMTKIYRAIGDNAKSLEYKKRADSIQ